jgi:hypothetical protein
MENETLLKCDFCGVVGADVVNYRQTTLYEEDTRNLVNACPACRIENDQYWKEQWEELWDNCS